MEGRAVTPEIDPPCILKIEIVDGVVYIEDAAGWDRFPLASVDAIKRIDAAFLAFRDEVRKAKQGAKT